MTNNTADDLTNILVDTFESQTSNMEKSSILELKNTNDIDILNLQCTTTFNKVRGKDLDIFLHDEIRPRTHSMPTRGTIKRPETGHLQRALFKMSKVSDYDSCNLRSFEISSKGVLTKHVDPLRSRSTNSIYCPEDYSLALASSTSQPDFKDIVALKKALHPIRIMVIGVHGSGKTGLMQQFMTSEYLGGFNTSVGKS